MTAEETMKRLAQIDRQCDEDIAEDTMKTRDSYNQIRAFHYDAVSKQIEDYWCDHRETDTESVESVCDSLHMQKNGNRNYMAGWNDALRAVKRRFGWIPGPEVYQASGTDEGGEKP
jgi:hypothetical protein